MSIAVIFTAVKYIPASTQQNPVKQLLETKQCPECNFSNANMKGLDLQGFNLQGANLEGANLSGAKLANANLKNANVNEPDGQRITVRPQASFSFFAKAFLSDEVPPPLS